MAPDAGAPEPSIIEPLCAVFRRKLRAEGLKYTPERARVLATVLEFEGLFDAESITASVRTSGLRVSKATVYRTVRLLQEAGVIQRVMLDREQALYQVVYGKAPSDLIILLDTGEAIQINVPELAAIRDAICALHGVLPQGHRFQVFATRRP
jgi:Fur family ferric uptake transcriptional regulator